MPSKGHGCGVNHNGIWAAQGHPVDVVALQGRWTAAGISYRGSDASGIVVAIGENVTDVQIGDEVVMHCGWWDEDAVDDQIMDRSAKIWGYEVNFGAFAEYTRVKQTALLPKPKHLSWEEAASYMLCGATAYRMLYGFAPHTLKPGDVVLIWGGSGDGSDSYPVGTGGRRHCNRCGQQRGKAAYCMENGAHGTINRRDYKHWGPR